MTSKATWSETTLGQVVTFQRGFDITKKEQTSGPYAVISSSGPTSTNGEYKVEGPGVVIGRKGSLGGVYFTNEAYWPHDTTLWVRDFHGNDPRFVYYFLQTLGLEHFDVGASNPTLNRNHLHMLPVHVPPIGVQRAIATVLSTYDELIENYLRRIQLLEEMARAIYREWFVEYRFPGHTDQFISSLLGRIPQGWAVNPLHKLQAREHHAITSGPFGSKLGRKDYVDRGVPVLRGTNLMVGGGFKDADFVYVSDAKAATLESSLAHPGDIVVTQRGTLGQVGLIPATTPHRRYVLSQSQMKVTVNLATTDVHYVYAVLRSRDTITRIQDMAISAGVPHINLTMLREFPIVTPPTELQHRFGDLVHPMHDLSTHLGRSVATARAQRDLLLPRLISGEVDVSDLDLDTTPLVA